jgi:hypothetical protein
MATRKKRPLQSKASLSSDWYWEQDAELRFVRLDVQTGAPGEQELAQKNLGRRPWETGLSVEGGWEAHRDLLGAHAPFREVLMWRDFDDASRRYISVSGQPVFNAKGRFTGYRGVGRDITRQKRSELLLRLQHSVTRGMAEADGARSAKPKAGTAVSCGAWTKRRASCVASRTGRRPGSRPGSASSRCPAPMHSSPAKG